MKKSWKNGDKVILHDDDETPSVLKSRRPFDYLLDKFSNLVLRLRSSRSKLAFYVR